MESRRTPGPASLRHHDAVLGCLREAGFSIELTIQAYSVQDAYVYGFALQERALPAFDEPGVGAQVAERMLRVVPAGAYPYSEEMVGRHIASEGYSLTAEFEFGLDLILDGLDPLRDPA